MTSHPLQAHVDLNCLVLMRLKHYPSTKERGRRATIVLTRALLRLQSRAAVHWSIQHLQHHAGWTATHSHAASIKCGYRAASAALRGHWDTVYLIDFFSPSWFIFSSVYIRCLQSVYFQLFVSLFFLWIKPPVPSNYERKLFSPITDARTPRFCLCHRVSLPSSRQAWRKVTPPLGFSAAAASHVQCCINKPRRPTTGSPCRRPGVRRSPDASCDMTARGRRRRIKGYGQGLQQERRRVGSLRGRTDTHSAQRWSGQDTIIPLPNIHVSLYWSMKAFSL